MSKLLTEQELRDKLGELLLHDDGCTTPDPQGCSCGALLVRMNIASLIQSQKLAYGEMVKSELLFDLDEIDNKPWRVFRQLAKVLPSYKDEYERYERFYEQGGGNQVEKLIEAFEQRERNV